MVDVEEIRKKVEGSFSFADVEELDSYDLALMLDLMKEDIDDESKFMETVVDSLAHKTTVRNHLPDFDLREVETFVQYFADRDYVRQWKEDMEIDYRLLWDTSKSPEDVALEVIPDNSLKDDTGGKK